MPIKKKNLPEEPKLHINSMLANFYHRISQTKICEWKTEWIWVFRIHAYGILSQLRIKAFEWFDNIMCFIYSYRRYIKEIGNNLTDVSDQNWNGSVGAIQS